MTARAAASVACSSLTPFDRGDLSSVRSAFKDAQPLALRQTWLPEPSSAFAPGAVRMGWRDRSLYVFAELSDTDVFTTATDDNQRFWELGDTFEIFLGVIGDPGYAELHVAPSNHRLHLRFADAESFRAAGAFERALRSADAFESRTWINQDRNEWCVLAEIPAPVIDHAAQSLAGREWRFSFSRYDATRGEGAPVISSTSPHAEASFHRQHEWGTIRFIE